MFPVTHWIFPACHAVAMFVNITYSETVEWELVRAKFCSEKSSYERLEVILT
jgi:hypothetical protein